jgi:alcohol dehydrogenase (cytochrome c)
MRRSFLPLFAATLMAQPAPEAGRKLYDALCASCHSADGRGGERGPEIVSAARLRARNETSLREVILKGVPNAGMPPIALPADQLDLVVAHVRQLIAAAERAAGSRGGRAADYPRVVLTLRDGREVRGLVRNESNYDLQVQAADGRLVALKRDDVVSRREEGRAGIDALPVSPAPRPFAAGDWPTYHGDPRANRHSPHAEITSANVARLGVKWIFPMRNSRRLEVTPVVVDGIMYVTAANEAVALDAATGRQIWAYQRPRTAGVVGDAGSGINRGVAISGDLLFMVTDHAHLIALDRRTGRLVWDVEMADYRKNYGATGAPLIVKDLVISGHSGGDEGARGFLAAYKAATGEPVWRFWTVPLPGEPGSETWRGSVLPNGCAATWLTGSYDPEADILYWPTGNPCPDYNGDERQGDNLYSDSVIALQPATGKLLWHYQFTPHDLHDWDAVQPLVLADAPFGGRQRKLLLQGNRNGFFYVLDRITGELLLAQPFVKNLTWATAIGKDGRPQRIASANPTPEGTRACPAVEGATNWMSSAYNPATGFFYLIALEKCTIYTKRPETWQAGRSFYGGSTRNTGDRGQKFVRAIDPQTGSVAWEYAQVGPATAWGGVLSTAGGVLFYGDDSGAFAALDARSGKPLWHFHTNETWKASPMTYLAGGRQYVAVASGPNIIAFGLP